MDRNYDDFIRKLLIIFIIFSVGFLLLFLTWKIFHLLLLLFASILFAVFLLGLGRKIASATPIPEKGAVWIVIVLFFGLLFGINYFIGGQLAAEFSQLSQSLQSAVSDLRNSLNNNSLWNKISKQIPPINEILQPKQSYIQKAFGVFSTTIGILADILVFIALALFIATSPKLYVKGILLLVPKSKTKRADEILDKLSNTLFNWLAGRLLDMLVLGILTAIGLWIIGVPLAITLGLLTAILSFIPNIGPFLAVIPPALVAFTIDPQKVLYVIILFIVIQLLESYFLTPYIQKRAVSIAPVLLLMAQLIMAFLAGLLGLLLATPIAAVILVLVRNLYVKDVLGKEINS